MPYEKDYIGAGKQIGQFGDVQVTLSVEDVKRLAYINKYNGKEVITFTVSQRRAPGKFGETHTVFVNKKTD